MKLSRTLSYAVKGAALLAEAPPGPVPCRELAEKGQMPERFLLQILRGLVNHGILVSTRGVEGGYALNRPADEVSLLDVFEAIDGGVSFELEDCEPMSDGLRTVMHTLSEDIRNSLGSIRLSDLADTEEAQSPLPRAPEHQLDDLELPTSTPESLV